MWVEFLITAFLVVIAPGTGVIYTIGIGLSRGARASFAAAVGCTCGIVPHLLAALAGLATLLHASAVAFQAVKWAGVCYLLYLAWAILMNEGTLSFNNTARPARLTSVAKTGFIINILNPKLSIFFLAFLPQFVPVDIAAPIRLMLALGGVFMVITFGVFLCYGAFAAHIRVFIQTKPSVLIWMQRCFSGAFLSLGFRLAFETRS